MLSEHWFASLAVAAVILITAGYLVSTEPEELSVTSEDGVVTVAGLARQTQPLAVSTQATVRAPLLGSAYHITPDLVTLEEPAVVSFAVLPPQLETIESLNVYRFHPSLSMWEPVSPIVAHTDEVIAVETAQLGSFAVGSVPTFAVPIFANVYDELRMKAPDDAVGYEIAVGFTQTDHEVIRLLSVGEHGGCGGVVRVGDGESLSQLERRAAVEIADTQETLTFVFVTRWFTSSTDGCASDALLRPADEYDILDDIQT
jgi:hypothetical protein